MIINFSKISSNKGSCTLNINYQKKKNHILILIISNETKYLHSSIQIYWVNNGWICLFHVLKPLSALLMAIGNIPRMKWFASVFFGFWGAYFRTISADSQTKLTKLIQIGTISYHNCLFQWPIMNIFTEDSSVNFKWLETS